jgi:hypothetical protein
MFGSWRKIVVACLALNLLNSEVAVGEGQAATELSIFQTYLRLRDGVKPSKEQALTRTAFHEFALADNYRALSQEGVALRSTNPNCVRFLNLYDMTEAQLKDGYGELLGNEKLAGRFGLADEQEVRDNLESRVLILHLFEDSLFATALMGIEGGASPLQASAPQGCNPIDRKDWLNLLFQAHDKAERLRLLYFGQMPATSPVDETERIRDSMNRYERRQTVFSALFLTVEVATAVLVWELTAARMLSKVALLARFPRMARISVGGIYSMGIVFVDRSARGYLPLLKPTPEITDPTTISETERMLTLGEEFENSNLVSPELYYRYLKLMSLIERQMAMDFLTNYQDELTSAEHRYGSIDAAISKQKELNHENGDPAIDSSNLPPASVGAPR